MSDLEAAAAGDEVVSGQVHPELFRAAMTRFASGVTIVTTRDDGGEPWGFTASAFSSLSLEPPLVLVCLATSAQSHPAFVRADEFIVNVLGTEHEELALLFARKGVDKFATGAFRDGVTHQMPVLDDALVSLRCTTHARHKGGDHTILIGHVQYARVRHEGAPALQFDRRFWDIAERS